MSVLTSDLSPAAAALLSRLWNASCRQQSAAQRARLDRMMIAILAAA